MAPRNTCSRNSDPGSHRRLFSPPTHYGSCLAFLSQDDFSSFFHRRLASNYTWYYLFIWITTTRYSVELSSPTVGHGIVGRVHKPITYFVKSQLG